VKLIVIALLSLGFASVLEYLGAFVISPPLCGMFNLDDGLECLPLYFWIALLLLLLGLSLGFVIGNYLVSKERLTFNLKNFYLSLITGSLTILIDGLIIAGVINIANSRFFGMRGVPSHLDGPGFVLLGGLSFLFWLWITTKLKQKFLA